MSITLGALVGSNTSTGSKTVAVTLTAGCPAGNPTTAEGLIVVTAKQQSGLGTNPMDDTDALVRPGVTDTASPAAPYNMANQLLGRIGWQGSPLVGIGNGSVLVCTGQGVMWNGAFFYECLAPLSPGDVVTIDYSHNPHNIDWLGARLYRVTGIRGDAFDAQELGVLQPDGSTITGAATTATTIPFGTLGYNMTSLVTLAGVTDALLVDTSSAPDALSWQGGSLSSLGAVWPFTNPLPETDHWLGTLVPDCFGDGPVAWRIGYAFYNFVSPPSATGRVTRNPDPEGGAPWDFMFAAPGPGWPIPGDAFVHMRVPLL